MLLEKVGSGPALSEFLATQEGARLLDQLQEPSQPRSNAKLSITSTITGGEGFQHREIADILGVKENGVRVMLMRARKQLAAKLAREGMSLEEPT